MLNRRFRGCLKSKLAVCWCLLRSVSPVLCFAKSDTKIKIFKAQPSEMQNNEYTGFSNCKCIAEFEKRLKLRKIARKNALKLSTEAILEPSGFLKYIEEIRSKINYKKPNLWSYDTRPGHWPGALIWCIDQVDLYFSLNCKMKFGKFLRSDKEGSMVFHTQVAISPL